MVRGVIGVVVGVVVWWMGFFGLARVLYLIWPAYAAAAHEFVVTGVSGFTATMYGWNALFWVLAEIAGGWAAVLVARRRESAWVLGALLMAFLCFMHLYLEWDRFPGLYNFAVALPSGVAVLLGGRLAGRFVRSRAAVGSAGAANVATEMEREA
jgi:hypothetical protein